MMRVLREKVLPTLAAIVVAILMACAAVIALLLMVPVFMLNVLAGGAVPVREVRK